MSDDRNGYRQNSKIESFYDKIGYGFLRLSESGLIKNRMFMILIQ